MVCETFEKKKKKKKSLHFTLTFLHRNNYKQKLGKFRWLKVWNKQVLGVLGALG